MHQAILATFAEGFSLTHGSPVAIMNTDDAHIHTTSALQPPNR